MTEESTTSSATVTKQPETFSREYVQELREENKRYRLASHDAEAKFKTAQETFDKTIAEHVASKTQAEDRANQRIILAELKAEAIKHGIVDMDGLKLADLSSLKLDEKGDVVGADALLKALKESKPYLFVEKTSTSSTAAKPTKADEKPFDAKTATEAERKKRLAEIMGGKA